MQLIAQSLKSLKFVRNLPAETQERVLQCFVTALGRVFGEPHVRVQGVPLNTSRCKLPIDRNQHRRCSIPPRRPMRPLVDRCQGCGYSRRVIQYLCSSLRDMMATILQHLAHISIDVRVKEAHP